MPAAKDLQTKYNELQEEIIEVREYSNGLVSENNKLKKKLFNLKSRIKNLYFSLEKP